MPVKMHCPNGHAMLIRDEHVGRQVKCPACKTSFRLADLSARRRKAVAKGRGIDVAAHAIAEAGAGRFPLATNAGSISQAATNPRRRSTSADQATCDSAATPGLYRRRRRVYGSPRGASAARVRAAAHRPANPRAFNGKATPW